MKYVRRISGKWGDKEVRLLQNYGIEVRKGIDTFGIIEDEKYHDLVRYLLSVDGFKDRRTFVEFEQQEYLPFNKFMFWRGYGLAGEFSGSDYIAWKKEIFGEFCSCCLAPYSEPQKPFIFKKEVKISGKHLFFTMNDAMNYLFTDKDKYEHIFKKWGLGFKEVLIGRKERVSENLVQLDIPLSPYKLIFGNSAFGKTFSFDGSGNFLDYSVCPVCSRPLYSNQILDYFPDFEQDFEFDIVHTREWFGPFNHHIVISRRFAEFLVERKVAKWDSSYFIPVKKFTPVH